MPCEFYKQALTDAAAANEAPSRELAAHLNACAACRAFLAEERELFAVIDSGVHATVSAEMPPSLLPAVRAGLDGQKVSNLPWVQVGAVLASAALVLMAVVFVQRMRSTRRDPTSATSTVAERPSPNELPVVVAPRVQPERPASKQFAMWRSHKRVVDGADRPAEVAVLVPARQREEVDKLLAALSSGTVKADDLLVQKTAALSPTGEVAPLGIPEIQIKPLAAVSEDFAPTR